MKEVIIVAGGNGVGKTTWAHEFLSEHPSFHFLNADELAKEISSDDPRAAAISGGRAFLRRQNELVSQGAPFVLESTLSGKYLIRLIGNIERSGYQVKIVFFFVDSPETLIVRIKNRVAKGGHFVPDDDVRRRFERGKQNFWHNYRNLADSWVLFYNRGEQSLRVAGSHAGAMTVEDDELYRDFLTGLDL